MADTPPTLAELDVKYVLVAHEVDWESYKYLGSESNMQVVGDYGSITVYRNLLWTKAPR